MLMKATTTTPGEPFDDLEELYGRVLGQWSLEMNHVAAIVGGFNSQQKAIGQQGLIFSPITKQKQAGAVKFLNENAFKVPAWATDTEILRRIEPVGVLDRVKTGQQRVLGSLLSSARITRLVEQETLGRACGARSTARARSASTRSGATSSARTSRHWRPASTARRRRQTMRGRSSGGN
jgi:hypothetical protein